jgi:hypothetical protein
MVRNPHVYLVEGVYKKGMLHPFPVDDDRLTLLILFATRCYLLASPTLMDSPPIPHGESSTSSDATLSYGPVVEMDVFPFTPYDPCALPHAHPTSQSGSPHPQFDPTEPSFATGGSSSFFSTAHAPPPVHFSTWNDLLSDYSGPSTSSLISGPSESSMYATQHASGDNVCHAVVSNWFLLTSPLCRQVVEASNQSASSREREHKPRGVLPCITVSEHTGGRAIPASSHPEHVVLWYLVCWNAVIVTGPRKFVPQAIYEPYSQGDKERYVSLAKLHPPIIFLAQDSPEWGIPISNLLSKQSAGLVDGNEPAFASCGPSIAIRVQVFRSFWCCLSPISMTDGPPVARLPTAPQTGLDERLHSQTSHDQQGKVGQSSRKMHQTIYGYHERTSDASGVR